MRRYATGSSIKQLAHTKTCFQLSKEGSLNGMAMSRGLLVSRRISCKEQQMATEEGVVRESDRKKHQIMDEYFRIVEGIEGSERTESSH